MEGKVKCPVCGHHYFGGSHDLDLCPICFWYNDEHQLRDPNLVLTNELSLNEARKAYKNGVPIRPWVKPRYPDTDKDVRQYDEVLLKDGRKASVVEILNDSYIVDIDIGGDYETRTIDKSEVVKVLFS